MSVLYDFGMIGLGAMGRNFILNVADRGYSAAGLDLDEAQVGALMTQAAGKPVWATSQMAEFVSRLRAPRRVMLLVPAGKAVDAVIGDLLQHLSPGDLIIDGGNSHFPDTERRERYLQEKGLRFLGVGVSGGAEGARRGPSIMPGGDPAAYDIIRPIFEAVAAKANGEPCVAYMGRGAAGHYVKMTHNGIEYALMQLIAEAYDVLSRGAGLDNDAVQAVFARWGQGRLRSFLIDISADILRRRDEESGHPLVELILDKAKQKGTGKWTSQNAMDLGVPIPTIDAAVSMRGISSFKNWRVDAAGAMPAIENAPPAPGNLVEHLETALYFSFVIAFAQGMHLLAEASREYDYRLNLARIASIWREGCIIRAGLLEPISQVFARQSAHENIALAEPFQRELIECLAPTRAVLAWAGARGVPLMAMGTALHYFQAFHAKRLPLNLLQAQRDYFGNHTYERIDKKGVFHTDWKSAGE
jgi:6-phosphogluconate dehydrogenase